MRAAMANDPNLPLRRRIALIVLAIAILATLICLRVAYEARIREQHAYLAGLPNRSLVSFAAPSVKVTMKRLSYSESAIDGASAMPS